MNIKNLIAKLISLTHLASICFLVFGFLLPKSFLIIHIVFVILTVLQWKLNKNQCVLTQWQHRLEGRDPSQKLEGHFTSNLVKKIGFDLNQKQRELK